MKTIILQKLISFKTNGDIRGSKILACGFFMWFIVLIIVNYIKEGKGIINNGNILTDGRCFKNCR